MALYTKLERCYFEEKTSRATMFYVTTNQLTKAITGIDYKSGPHAYKRKNATDADSTTPVKVQKNNNNNDTINIANRKSGY